MSLQVTGVWKGAVWASPVWTQGVWYEPVPVGPAEPTGAGWGRKRKLPFTIFQTRDPLATIQLPEDPKSRAVAIKALRVIAKARKKVEARRIPDNLLATIQEQARLVAFFVEIQAISRALEELEEQIMLIQARATEERIEDEEMGELLELI